MMQLSISVAFFIVAATQAPPAPAPVEVALLNTKITAKDVGAQCEQAEKDTDAKLVAIASVPDDKKTFAGTFEAFDDAVGNYGETVQRLTFLEQIHTDKTVRDAATECEERSSKYLVQLGARKDLYDAMKGFLAHGGKKAKLDADGKRLVDLTMRDFKRNGLELKEDDRKKLVELRSHITELESKYSKALAEDTTHFDVAKDELDGLPDDFVKAHASKTAKGMFTLTTKYPDYYPIMENATKEETRKKMEIAFENRGGVENIKLLDEAAALRAEAAHLLGYKTHADYVAEDRMAKNATTIAKFLARMKKGLDPALASDTAKMVALKGSGPINAWDWRYFMNQIKKRDYAIDDEKVRAYFPADKVLAGMFQVYSTLFNIKIVEVPFKEAWADGVKLFEVHDAQSDKLVAKFYVDLFPRDGKYGHAAEFTLAPGHLGPDGYHIPLAALVVNFQPPANGQVAHLSMDEVDTLFHEFGHVMHESLTTAKYASQAGTHVALDFVEAPSQMLENWAYEPEVLKIISDGIPDDLAQKVKAARKYDAGVHYDRQVFLAMFDQAIHTQDKPDSDAVAKKEWADIMKFPEDPSEHFAATFGHMMGGYDGGYYGYLWSEVFAADMFTRFQKEGVLNPKTGREYRDRVISRGRTVDPEVLLKDFLGRSPNEDAFIKMLGIKAAK